MRTIFITNNKNADLCSKSVAAFSSKVATDAAIVRENRYRQPAFV
jgi:hypothetical protein